MPKETVTDFDNTGGQGVVDFVLKDKREVFLTIGGETAFQIGWDLCDTCTYLFTKVMPAQRLTDGTTDEIARGVSAALKNVGQMPKPEALAEFGMLLAPGKYSVALVRLSPELAFPGGPNDYFAHESVATWGLDPYYGVPESPRTPYYRLGTAPLGDVPYGGKQLGVVLGVPLYPPTQRVMNREDVIDAYRATLRAGVERPTALALGLADDRGPATWDDQPEYSRHLIVTLHVLDGHHKIAAAAAEQVPLQFLVFLPYEHLGRDWREVVDRGTELLRSLSS